MRKEAVDCCSGKKRETVREGSKHQRSRGSLEAETLARDGGRHAAARQSEREIKGREEERRTRD